MKKLITGASILFFAFSSYALPDYSLCSDFIKSTNDKVQLTGFAFPFAMNPETGEMKRINYNMDLVKDDKSQTYSSKGYAGSRKIKVLLSDLNKLDKIEIEDTTKKSSGENFVTKSTIQFNIKNGKCYPEISYKEFKVNDKDLKATLFDTKLCKQIQDFFDNNKTLKQCFDPDSKEGKAMTEVFKKNGYDSNKLISTLGRMMSIFERTTYSVEQKIIAGNPNAFDVLNTGKDEDNKRMMGMTGGSPVISGYMILNDCYQKGLLLTLRDETIWKSDEGKSKTTVPVKANNY